MTVLLFVFSVFVLLLLWGSSSWAPEPVQKFAARVGDWEARLLYRIRMAWRSLRGGHDYTGHGILGVSKMNTLKRPTQTQIQQRMHTQVIAPPSSDEERRLFFLFEVQLHTELVLNITDDDVLHISKRDMKVLNEYCTLYANPVGDPKRLFLLHGIRISVEKNPQTAVLDRR